MAEGLIRAVTEAQARADLATGSDIKDLRQEVQSQGKDLRQEIEALRLELKQDMTTLENRLIKWMLGLILPLYALQIAVLLAKLF